MTHCLGGESPFWACTSREFPSREFPSREFPSRNDSHGLYISNTTRGEALLLSQSTLNSAELHALLDRNSQKPVNAFYKTLCYPLSSSTSLGIPHTLDGQRTINGRQGKNCIFPYSRYHPRLSSNTLRRGYLTSPVSLKCMLTTTPSILGGNPSLCGRRVLTRRAQSIACPLAGGRLLSPSPVVITYRHHPTSTTSNAPA